MAEFRLSYTAEEINKRLGKIGNLSWNDLKDKPFYDNSSEIEIFAEQEIILEEDGIPYLMISPAPFVLVEGETYRVVLDGEEYTLTCELSEGIPALVHFVTDESGEATDGTFQIRYVPQEFAAEFGFETDIVVAIILGETLTRTVSLYHNKTDIKKIDSKLINFENTTDIFPQTTLAESEINRLFGGYATETESFELIVGNTYNVSWDGKEYVCVAQEASDIGGEGSVFIGNGIEFGLLGNGEPFGIAIVGAVDCALFIGNDTEPTAHTVRIYQTENVIEKMIDEYMEKALGGEY